VTGTNRAYGDQTSLLRTVYVRTIRACHLSCAVATIVATFGYEVSIFAKVIPSAELTLGAGTYLGDFVYDKDQSVFVKLKGGIRARSGMHRFDGAILMFADGLDTERFRLDIPVLEYRYRTEEITLSVGKNRVALGNDRVGKTLNLFIAPDISFSFFDPWERTYPALGVSFNWRWLGGEIFVIPHFSTGTFFPRATGGSLRGPISDLLQFIPAHPGKSTQSSGLPRARLLSGRVFTRVSSK